MQRWRKPYWVEGQFWWLGGTTLTLLCVANWWIAARYLAPVVSPPDSIERIGVAPAFFLILSIAPLLGILLGYSCERIIDESVEKPEETRLHCLIYGLVGVMIFGILTWQAACESPLNPRVFAFGGGLVWTLMMGLAGIFLRDKPKGT